MSGSTVYAAGEFTSIGGQPRHHLAALDGSTGGRTRVRPDRNSEVQALDVTANRTLVVTGYFRTMELAPQQGVARFCP